MCKFHSIAALCGDKDRPELQALFQRLAIDTASEILVPDPAAVAISSCPLELMTPAEVRALIVELERRLHQPEEPLPVRPKQL